MDDDKPNEDYWREIMEACREIAADVVPDYEIRIDPETGIASRVYIYRPFQAKRFDADGV